MSQLTLALFGGFEVQAGPGRPLVVPTRKAQGLLAYLALTPDQTHPRDKLAALLWGDASPDSARNALRQTLFVLRKAIGSDAGSTLVVTGDAITLPVGAVASDVAAFEQALAVKTPVALEAAAGLYRGDFLAGLDVAAPAFEDWLMSERERLRELALEALARLLAHQRAAGLTSSAVQSALRLLAIDPLQEAVHRTLMRLYLQLGRRDAALRQYQVCVDALRRELGIEPEAESKGLYQEILKQPPLRSATTAVVATATRSDPRVGRDLEVTRLREALVEAWAGHGQIVAVLGEAGIGKSHLLAELVVEAERRGGAVLVGRAYESEQILPFGPWVAGLREGGALSGESSVDSLGEPWRSELARLFPELARDNMSAQADRGDHLRLFEAMVRLVRHLALQRPLLIVLEDQHWADEMSVRFLAFLARRLREAPILIAVSVRDEELAESLLLQRTLDELAGEQHLSRLELPRLNREDTSTLVRLLGGTGIAATSARDVVERVWAASEGNPFMVVETMRGLGQGLTLAPGSDVPLPTRVRDMITRRLGRLSSLALRLVRVAAVIGREFEFTLLQSATGVGEREAAEGVEELVRRRIIHGVGDRFDFTHERIRDVVAAELLPPRPQIHARIVEAIELLHTDRLGEQVERLAYHAVRGGLQEKAVRYLRQAALKAAAVSALQDARVWFEQALGVLETLPESRATMEQGLDIRLELRGILNQLGEVRQTRERLREAEGLAERLNDDHRRGQVYALLTNTHSMLGELDEARATGARVLTIVDRLGDVRLSILSRTCLEHMHFHSGEYERVCELARDNLAALRPEWIYEKFGNATPAAVYDRFWLILSLAKLGRFVEAAEHEAMAIRLAEPTQHAFTMGLAYFAGGTLHFLKGDWAKARSVIERGISVTRAANCASLLSHGIAAFAWVLAQLGEQAGAARSGEEAAWRLEEQEARGHVGLFGWAYYMLGCARLLLGPLDEAQRLGYHALEFCPYHPGFAAFALQLLGDIASHPDRFDAERGETYYRKALALAEPRGMRPLVAHCHLGLGKLYRSTGKREQAQEHLATATAMYRDMDMRFWLEKAETELRERS
jgi:DNA-binding SARP family transcriptional activator/ABC-type cobalamin/Fe3+-siderophores transport system ATPase subunit